LLAKFYIFFLSQIFLFSLLGSSILIFGLGFCWGFWSSLSHLDFVVVVDDDDDDDVH
jgi:hypothetical protein